MDVFQRNYVRVLGNGAPTFVFAHGFGCDQNMWRLIAPMFASQYKVVLFDLTGAGRSDPAAYDYKKYDSLHGYADDLIEIIKATTDGPVMFVGHSVSAMIGVLAEGKAPELFAGHVMIGPSPCYINDGDYEGGFSREDILSLLDTLGSNYLGWSSTMAPAIMGSPDQPELAEELTNSFCQTDPEIAKQFARVTFLSDHRADLANVTVPTLIIQCSDDLIAPQAVGQFMHRAIPGSTLRIIENIGHCPHLSAPEASVQAMQDFLVSLGRPSVVA
ncbi:sigma-B regulation protein RsbQ [Rhodanobacter sp. K2T2]|uniref:alpha/beta fold hydrolase n=1 Tax=Rhodanobacter sp. K2T2 TaxID=2723085 RepID=UPI0015CC4B7C|nr:alpha/beta hydrolase [Rhodanobacter sp. K2T2]NYE30070.1 sigma-B regulation protein RsbQ [Rhodanobacter sp. K2T2]